MGLDEEVSNNGFDEEDSSLTAADFDDLDFKELIKEASLPGPKSIVLSRLTAKELAEAFMEASDVDRIIYRQFIAGKSARFRDRFRSYLPQIEIKYFAEPNTLVLPKTYQ